MAKPKNRVEARLEGNEIQVRIIASGEEMAHRIFDALELFGVAVIRVDLEKEWKEDGGDRDCK